MNGIGTPRRDRRYGRLVAVPVVGVVALVGLAACGTGTDTAASAASDDSASASAPSGAAGTGGPSDAAMAAYASCLTENGVTLPERPARGSGAPDDGTPPSGAPAAPGDGGSGGGRAGGPGGPGRAPGKAPEGVDADTWAAAQQACADLAPTPPTGGGPAAGSGT